VAVSADRFRTKPQVRDPARPRTEPTGARLPPRHRPPAAPARVLVAHHTVTVEPGEKRKPFGRRGPTRPTPAGRAREPKRQRRSSVVASCDARTKTGFRRLHEKTHCFRKDRPQDQLDTDATPESPWPLEEAGFVSRGD